MEKTYLTNFGMNKNDIRILLVNFGISSSTEMMNIISYLLRKKYVEQDYSFHEEKKDAIIRYLTLKKNRNSSYCVNDLCDKYGFTKTKIDNLVINGKLQDGIGLFDKAAIEAVEIHDDTFVSLDILLGNYCKDNHIIHLPKTINEKIRSAVMKSTAYCLGKYLFRKLSKKEENCIFVADKDYSEIFESTIIKNYMDVNCIDNFYFEWKTLSKYPETIESLKKIYEVMPFAQNNKLQPKLHYVMQILICANKNVFDLTNGDLEALKKLHIGKRRKSVFMAYLGRVEREYYDKVKFNTKIVLYENKIGKEKEKEAYSQDTYFKFGYLIFSQESFEKKKIGEKIMQDDELAQLMFYTAMLYFCTWRKTDILSIVTNDIDNLQEYIDCRNDIQNEKFDNACSLFTKMTKDQYANKNGGELRLIPSKMLRKMFGLYFVIAKYHQIKDGRETLFDMKGSFISVSNYKKIFGERTYSDLFGDRVFNHTRINKTYLLYQAQKSFREKTMVGIRDLPEVLTAYIRGHKLRDFNFDTKKKGQNTILHYIGHYSNGQDYQEVIEDAFQIGSFGHYATLILKMVIPDFLLLTARMQKELLVGIKQNHHPVEMEKRAELLMQINYDLGTNLFESYDEMCFSVGSNLLRKIATANEKNVSCLYSALTGRRNPNCKCSDTCLSDSCDGLCVYGIYSKQYILNLVDLREQNIRRKAIIEKQLSSKSYDFARTILFDELDIANLKIKRIEHIISNFVKKSDEIADLMNAYSKFKSKSKSEKEI